MDNLKEINNIIMLETPVSSREGTETFCLGTIPSLAFLLEPPFTSRGDGNMTRLDFYVQVQCVRNPSLLERGRKPCEFVDNISFDNSLETPVSSRGDGNLPYQPATNAIVAM